MGGKARGKFDTLEVKVKHIPLIAIMLATAANSSCSNFVRDCSEEEHLAEALPELLSEAGLYSDIAADVLSEAAYEFEPRFPLWTDGAKKRRWIVLPDGQQVDTQSLDEWVFPVGTKFFKEFTRDGVRIETRLNMRTDEGWAAAAYIWNGNGDDAIRQLESALDVGGTAHDVPSAGECLACHAGRGNFTLGFSATQLDLEARSELYERGALSNPVEADIDVSLTATSGLGYLHGNCSHCHNNARADGPQATDCYAPNPDDNFDLTLPANLTSVEEAPAVLTARWQLGEPDDSEILDRMSTRNLDDEVPSMPPLGTEVVDDEGVTMVEAFISELVESGL